MPHVFLNTARPLAALLGLALGAVVLSACSSDDVEYKYPTEDAAGARDPTGRAKPGGVFGEGGINLLGGNSRGANSAEGGIGVNSYLWRATLDSIAFMPLASADPFGGVIITDWYSPPETPQDRFKVNVFILGRELRADGVKASVFRQTRDTAGGWLDTQVAAQTQIDLENAILTRARQLRIASAAK